MIAAKIVAYFKAQTGCFADLLASSSTDASIGDEVFVARNFLLDEHVSEARGSEYLPRVASPGTISSWRGRHNDYLDELVAWQEANAPRGYIDPGDPKCPRTFGPDASFASYGASSAELKLVSMTRTDRLAVAASVDLAKMASAVSAFEHDGDREPLDGILYLRGRQRGRWPVFATFWADVSDLLPVDVAAAPADWASRLRDRLGLTRVGSDSVVHQVLVEAYEVAIVPCIRKRPGTRALTIPTVLDGAHYDAFCPAPRGESCGCVVDLAASLEQPKREVLHPPVDTSRQASLRVGYVTSAPPPLRPAREAHLMYVRVAMGVPTYGQDTDGDLL